MGKKQQSMQWGETTVYAVYQRITFRVSDLHAADACHLLS